MHEAVLTVGTLVLLVTISAMPFNEETERTLRWKSKGMSVEGVRPEVFMDATELITSKGWPCENHWVITEDGYILNMQRIPYGWSNKNSKDPRPVVLLQHGLLLSSAAFLLNSAKDSLALVLADSGLDVWLANSRGNIYSTNHTRLDTRSPEFWDFSWVEMARYDLPAMIDYVSSRTGQGQISYVGYSQGTTIGFAALSQTPRLATKLKQFIALAPVGRVGNVTSVIRLVVPHTAKIQAFLKLFPNGNFDIDREASRNLVGRLCHERSNHMCERMWSLLVGSNPRSFDMSRLEVYMGHIPAGTSVRNLLHWAQAAKGGRFQHYDWGNSHENWRRYGQPHPPQYDLGKVNMPVAIFRGGHDALADTEDVRWLLPQLNVTRDVAVDYYNHMDFIAAPDAPEKIYGHLIQILLA